MNALVNGQSLSSDAVFHELIQIMDDPVKLAGFLMLLKAKGETVEEILGIVRAMRAQMKPFLVEGHVLDIVGTGGDQVGTVNLSTASALLAAKCGAQVVKHGNRAISSRCGSADVLEALGMDIHRSEMKHNFAFCFAPDYHPKLKEVKKVRQALKTPTVFNVIGPLLNPAGTDHLLLGVYQKELVPVIAEVLFKLGTKKSLVFSGHGIDELSCIGPTEALLVTSNGIEPLTINPQELGFKACTLQDLLGKDALTNAQLIRNPTPELLDTIVLNVGVALFLYGTVSTIQEGIQIAKRKAMFQKGVIAEIPDVAKRAKDYEAAGAAVVSVLTSERFEGSLEDLRRVKEAVSIPVLRKDFIVKEEQLKEGTSELILLIVAFLGTRTAEMLQAAEKMGYEAIVEIHNEEELVIALEAKAKIIGVNQRNLKDFTMHPEVYALIQKIPDSIVKIAESGVKTKEDAQKMFDMGFDAVLVGEALTKNPQLAEVLCSLKSVV